MATAFAGPLSRYYGVDAAAAARLRAGVEAWRADLRGAVASRISAQLHWDEGAAVAAAMDLGDSGWPGLRLFAFYSERSELDFPDTVPALLELDATWRAAQDTKFGKSLYGQLLACRVWLPADFPVTLRLPLPDGETAEVGSLHALVDQLRWLNQRTFQAEVEEFVAWCELEAPAGGDLLRAARRGYGTLMQAAERAKKERLPLLVREP